MWHAVQPFMAWLAIRQAYIPHYIALVQTLISPVRSDLQHILFHVHRESIIGFT